MRRFFKYIIGNINLLNIFLIIAAILFAEHIINPQVSMTGKYMLPKPDAGINEKEEISGQSQSLSFMDYMIIADKNPFHPERIIPVDKKEAPPLPKPELLLYGTTITDELSIAYIEDKKTPRSTPGRGKRHTIVKKGDSISGFVLKEIYADRIVLVRGEETMTVNLIDSSKPRDGSPLPVTPQRPAPAPARPPRAPVPQPIPQPEESEVYY